MSTPNVPKILLPRKFGHCDQRAVKVETEDGVIYGFVEVVAVDGTARFGRIEEVEFRAVEVRPWWRPWPARVVKRRVRVRFERGPNASQ